jgi:hypothetical protein
MHTKGVIKLIVRQVRYSVSELDTSKHHTKCDRSQNDISKTVVYRNIALVSYF